MIMQIYSKDGCPQCESAKKYLSERKIPFTEIKIGRDITREEFMARFPDVRTVPFIMNNESVVGDYQCLMESVK
jgi:glutaredoxin